MLRTSAKVAFSIFGLFCLLWQAVLSGNALGYSADDPSKTITSTGTLADTQDALAYVSGKAEDGWALTVGSAGGAYSWSSQLSVSIPHTLTIKGASASNRPTITSTFVGGQGIGLDCTTLKTITLKDIIFAEWTPANCLIVVSGGGVDCYRFTNLKFGSIANPHEGTSAAAYISPVSSGRTDAGPYGLIDHCDILGSGYGFFIRDNDSLSSWRRAMTFGAREANYIEDCTFGNTTFISGRPAVDANNGARFVFRHNTLVNQALGFHGADSSGPVESTLQFEVMHNTFSLTNNPPGITADTFFGHRGGTGVVFDNAADAAAGTWVNSFQKIMYLRASSNSGITVDRFYPAGYVGTQQPGCGYVGAAGQDPSYPSEPWGSVPIYSWGNSISGAMAGNTFAGIGGTPYSDTPFLELNRDYFLSAKPGYVEYTYPHPLQDGSPPPGTRKILRLIQP